MKTLSFEQMEQVNGGVNWCAVSTGVAGFGGLGLTLGASMGPIGLFAFAGFVTHATMCTMGSYE